MDVNPVLGRTVHPHNQWYSTLVNDYMLTVLVRNSTTNILAKYKDSAPSLIIHLHPTHFRFDQQVYLLF
jgi:hypothetical protein